MAERPTARMGSGGSGGAPRSPSAFIVSARRARQNLPPANDNRTPLRRRVMRAGVFVALALGTALVLYLI